MVGMCAWPQQNNSHQNHGQIYRTIYYIVIELLYFVYMYKLITVPDSKFHGANMGPTWVSSTPDGSHEPCYQGLKWYCPRSYLHTGNDSCHKNNILAICNREVAYGLHCVFLCLCNDRHHRYHQHHHRRCRHRQHHYYPNIIIIMVSFIIFYDYDRYFNFH